MIKRPVFLISIFYILGILSGQYRDGFIYIALFAMVLLILVILQVRSWGYGLLPLAFALGFVMMLQASAPVNREIDAHIGEELRVSGVVQSVIYPPEETGGCVILRGRIFKTNEDTIYDDIKIRMYSDKELHPGDIAVVKGELSFPRERSNPSDFDMKAYMLARGQYYLLYGEEVYVGGSHLSLNVMLQRFKERINQVYYHLLPKEDAALLSGMMLGDTGNIEEEINDLYKDTGIYHVIAISGLHITLLGGVLLKLLKVAGHRGSRIGTALILLMYCIMTGCSVSVVRSVIMVYLYIGASLTHRNYDILNGGATAALIILLYSPWYIFDVGFQFSFGAVGAIGIASRAGGRGWMETLKVSMAADLATKPVTMYRFYYINPWSVVANILLVPLMSLAVGIGFIIGILGLISPGIASLPALLIRIIFAGVEAWCRLFVSLPGSRLVTGHLSLWVLGATALVFVLGYLIISFKRYWLAYPLGAAYISLCLYVGISSVQRDTAVTFLNVGQGDCAVVLNKDYTLVVDGGGNPFSGKSSTGEYILLPYLFYSGCDRVDKVFVSHTDMDHIGGIIEIIGEIPIDEIYLPKAVNKNENYYRLVEGAKENNVEVLFIEAGDRVKPNKEDEVLCLSPEAGAFGDSNSISMVNKLVTPYGSVLFTGDIDKQVEERLVSRGVDLRADVLKLAHHGSLGSNSQEFLREVSPRIAIASAKKSTYNHPSDTVLERLRTMDIPCYITEQDGAVKVSLNKDAIRVSTYLNREDNQ